MANVEIIITLTPTIIEKFSKLEEQLFFSCLHKDYEQAILEMSIILICIMFSVLNILAQIRK